MRRGLAGRLLPPVALSNAAIAWSVAIGTLGAIAFVPPPGAAAHYWAALVPVTLVAEAGFVAVVLVMRRGRPGPARVALALMAAGALRGLMIAVGERVAGLGAPDALAVGGRVANSAVFCLLGGSLIGATLAWRRDFHEQYRRLLDRALLVDRAGRDEADIDRAVLASWTSVKADLDHTLRRAGEALAGEPRPQGLNDAAALLSSAVDAHLRPTARAMWQGALPERPPISTRTLLRAALADWDLPLRVILGFFAVIIGIGSVVRVGVTSGLAFTLAYLLITAAVLGASVLGARRWPAHAPAIAATALIALPVLLLAGTIFIANRNVAFESDRLADVIVAVQAPITTVLIAMAVEAGRQRERILESLQARIDSDAMGLMAREDGARADGQRLSVFMHHSVQSELAASAMQLREAALTTEPATMRAVSTAVLARLAAIQHLDSTAPPWLAQPSGHERIGDVVGAWRGILDVQVSLPDAEACRPHQWHVATQVIEEGLANAARHGDASRVVISGRTEAGALTLSIADDGARRPGDGGAGIGTQWLDRVAPGTWAFRQTPSGSTLDVTIL